MNGTEKASQSNKSPAGTASPSVSVGSSARQTIGSAGFCKDVNSAKRKNVGGGGNTSNSNGNRATAANAAKRKNVGGGGNTSNSNSGSKAPQSHRRGSIMLLRVLIVLGALLLLIATVRLLLLLVPIEEIVLGGESFYTMEELCTAAGLKTGDRMFGFSAGKLKERLCDVYPLLSDVTFHRSFNGTLKIVPHEVESSFYLRVSGSYYLLSRDELRVLEECNDPERFLAYGCYEISLPDVRVAFIGELLVFGENGKTGYLTTLLDTLEASFLQDRITGVRASEQFALSVLVDGKYDITLGSVSGLERKLENLLFVLDELLPDPESCAEIDLTDLSAPSVRKVDAIDTSVGE